MLAPAMNLERDGAVVVRGYLNEDCLAYLVSGQGDQTVREFWDSVGVVTLPSLNRCSVASDLARELSSLLEWEANRLLGPSYLLADHCSIRRMYQKWIRLEWHTDYDGGGTSPYDPCYIIWLPLTAVGINQPSVESCAGRICARSIFRFRPRTSETFQMSGSPDILRPPLASRPSSRLVTLWSWIIGPCIEPRF